jgi:LCP family protein required for cell wall assembly
MFEHLDDPGPPAFGPGARRAVVRRAQRRRRRRVAGGLGVAAASLVAGAGGLYGRAAYRASQVERIEVAGTSEAADGEPVTFLVRGVDGPAGGGDPGGRADTVLLARLDPSTGAASLLSLPRDLLVTDPATGGQVRLNGLAADAQVAFARDQLGITVNHVAQIDLDGFRSLVDLVGGVDVAVPAPVRDKPTGLLLEETGCVRLDGDQALALVRARQLEVMDAAGRWQPGPFADLERTATQRAVLVAALADLAGRTDPVSVDRLSGWVRDHVAVDDDLGLGELTDLIRAALAVDPAAVETAIVPVVPAEVDANRLVVDPAAGPAAIDAFREGAALPAGIPGDRVVVDAC